MTVKLTYDDGMVKIYDGVTSVIGNSRFISINQQGLVNSILLDGIAYWEVTE